MLCNELMTCFGSKQIFSIKVILRLSESQPQKPNSSCESRQTSLAAKSVSRVAQAENLLKSAEKFHPRDLIKNFVTLFCGLTFSTRNGIEINFFVSCLIRIWPAAEICQHWPLWEWQNCKINSDLCFFCQHNFYSSSRWRKIENYFYKFLFDLISRILMINITATRVVFTLLKSAR